MKVTKEKAAQNRAALVEAAARLFRERGIDGVGVAEISKEAGLTHGALYAQFSSKDALAAEALAYGSQRANRYMAAVKKGAATTLRDQLDYYLSTDHRDNLGGGCAMAASASEIARQADEISARFSEGFEQLVGIVEATLGEGSSRVGRHPRALALVAAMVGGVAVARAVVKSRPELSAEVLTAVRRILAEVGGEFRPAPAGRAASARSKPRRAP